MQSCQKLHFANHRANSWAHHAITHRHDEQEEKGETVACSTEDTGKHEQETGHASYCGILVRGLEPKEVNFMVVIIGIKQPFTRHFKDKESDHRRDEVLNGHDLVAMNGAQRKPSEAQDQID